MAWARMGFDPVLGARPLRRLIQNEVEDRLSDEILSGRLVRWRCRPGRLPGRARSPSAPKVGTAAPKEEVLEEEPAPAD